MSADARGWRMALTADALINPVAETASLSDVLSILQTHRYGVLQLPPPGDYGPLLAVIADQVAEYSHHGYAVVALGVDGVPGSGLHWRRLVPLLRRRGVSLPPRHLIRSSADAAAEAQRLGAFLAAYDVPVEEQRRWRV